MAAATAVMACTAAMWRHSHRGFGTHHPHWHVRYHRPIWYDAAPVLYSAYAPRIVSPGPCTCLSKEYTPEGAVLFKDRCTNEAAINPPAPAPQQTGELAPQVPNLSAQQYVQPMKWQQARPSKKRAGRVSVKRSPGPAPGFFLLMF